MLKSILYLIPELFFDNKDEYKFNSAKFNARKTIAAIVLAASLIMNVFMINRLYAIANRNIALKAQTVQLTREVDTLKRQLAVQPPPNMEFQSADSPEGAASAPRYNFATRMGPQPRAPLDFSPAKNLWGTPSDDGKVERK